VEVEPVSCIFYFLNQKETIENVVTFVSISDDATSLGEKNGTLLIIVYIFTYRIKGSFTTAICIHILICLVRSYRCVMNKRGNFIVSIKFVLIKSEANNRLPCVCVCVYVCAYVRV
jgi:hypothetical protein